MELMGEERERWSSHGCNVQSTYVPSEEEDKRAFGWARSVGPLGSVCCFFLKKISSSLFLPILVQLSSKQKLVQNILKHFNSFFIKYISTKMI
jgi:hypothetical protein